MKNYLMNLILATLILLFTNANAEDTIAFQIIANGGNGGFTSVNNTVIDNDMAFKAFCDSVDLDPALLSYQPNFDSVQLIGIADGFSILRDSYTIRTIYTNGDTIWVEMTYNIPTYPEGMVIAAGYKYQIVAIPKQLKPIKFKLNELTTVNYRNQNSQLRFTSLNIGSNGGYDLIGRLTQINRLQRSSGVIIISNGHMQYKTKSMITKHK